jgi:outer membrane protein assembly factor BamB
LIKHILIFTLCCGFGVVVGPDLHGEDWPMWRHDANRSGTTPESLPEKLDLLWVRKLKPRVQVWDDPLNLDLMPYDRVFEPIVMDGMMFLGFNDTDKLIALDASSGKTLWTFFTEGPVRLPPVGWNGRVYFCSDDGFLYCVGAKEGKLQWRFRGGPAARKAIGNRRLISAWPARGGPVIRDGSVYFAASIWPFMGTFIYALDADSGAVEWVNDSTGSQYIQQPHSAPSFAGVAPQGALVATEKTLLVPGGRSVPAAFDRQTGELRYFHINAGGKGNGGSFLAANETKFVVHTRENRVRMFDLESGVKTAMQVNQPVLGAETCFAFARTSDGTGVVRCYNMENEVQWAVAAQGGSDLIRAGDSLYVAGPDYLTALDMPANSQPARVKWQKEVDGTVARLLAADGKLFTVTAEGEISAYGQRQERTVTRRGINPSPIQTTEAAARRAKELLSVGASEGYAIWYGADDEALLDAVVAQSPFVELAIVDRDPLVVDRLRRRFDQAGLYGKVTVHAATPGEFAAPPYIAHCVFVSKSVTDQLVADPLLAKATYSSVRPYGGIMLFESESANGAELARTIQEWNLERASVKSSPVGILVTRVGQLPGAANWTHQHGDPANTVKSNDHRVKLPLGVLWFGGNTNEDILPRHGHGPSEQVMGGRLFVQGTNSLSARDVYTGRLLWKRQFDDLGTFDVYFDSTYRDTPLDSAYNQVHIPGANARGTNYVVASDRVYVVEGSRCHVLDPATGDLLTDIELPTADERARWGFIGVYKDVLIGGAGFANYRARHGISFSDSDSKLTRNRIGFGSKSVDRSASAALVGFDRLTGEVLWKIDARHSFWHNGIVAGGGRIYCLDRNPKPIEDALRRRGKSQPSTYRVIALDHRSGELVWESVGDVFGTWLGYSEEHDLLLQAGAAGSDRLHSEADRGMAVYRGKDGALQWRDHSVKYSGPCIIHHDTILTNSPSRRSSAGAFSLIDGSQKTVENPLTGEAQPWTISRAYGCNHMIASENMLTFRSGAAGFYDLQSQSGTGNLGGFKSGCTSNLVVADGVLNAPDYTRSCSCSYQNQTSLALVHMPEIEMWAVNGVAQRRAVDARIRRLGVNLGAPGDRRSEEGTLWLEYPELAGQPANLEVEIEGEVSYYQHHSSRFESPMAWVFSSGVEAAETIRIWLGAKPSSSTAAPRTGEAIPYSVRLFFSEPRSTPAGTRVFDVSLQGKQVLHEFDVARESGQSTRVFSKQFDGILVADKLRIDFTAVTGNSILCGVEIIQERE